MDEFEQNLHIADSAFEGMRHDADRVLQKLLKNMVEKESLEGSVTIKIDVSFKQKYIMNTNPEIEGETRRVLTPSFSHKAGSMMQIKDEAKGEINYEGMEMVWEDEAKEFVIKPIANTTQRTIFDSDFQHKDKDKEEDYIDEENGLNTIEGEFQPLLPGPTADEEIEEDVEEADLDDITEELLGHGAEINEDDEYGYEEPEN